jgi:hypothetical protein
MGPLPSEGGPLELLASVQRVTELEETNIVLGQVVNEVAGNVELTKRELVMIPVVQDVDQISVERMDVLSYGGNKTGREMGEHQLETGEGV